MRRKLNELKSLLFTVNLTVLLTVNLFLIIAAVLLAAALAVWAGDSLGLLEWAAFLRPEAVAVLVYIIAILIGISMVVMIRLVILKPVRSMVAAMERLAGGDFSVRMAVEGWMRPLELRAFAAAFNAAAAELGSTELLRKDFINNFSHEFKTPITALGGFADLLLADEDMPAAERREYLSIISGESRRLADLANSVLALSRVEAQAILTDAAPFALDEQLRLCAMQVQQKWAGRRTVHLDVCLPEGGAQPFVGSRDLLAQVWVNLLDNAVKFSPQGGTVSVTLLDSPGEVAVTVTDQGPGMDEQTRAHMFEQFYQGDTSRKTEGNGLGLALVRKITALHGGAVTAASSPGHGSAFTVRLPRAGAPGK